MFIADNPGGVSAASGAELEPVPAIVAQCAKLGTSCFCREICFCSMLAVISLIPQ